MYASEGRDWAGRARSASAIRRAGSGSPGLNIRTRPSSWARDARMNCSMRGSSRGTRMAGLSNDRISQNVLYPPMATIPAAPSIRASTRGSKVSTPLTRSMAAARARIASRTAAGMNGPSRSTAERGRPGSCS